MLLVIILAVVIAGVACFVIYDRTNAGEWVWYTGLDCTIFGSIALVIAIIALLCSYCGLDGHIASKEVEYESLVYQYENNLYENDNDVGKKELMDQIQEWNSNLAMYKEIQDDFWIGIFIPDIYDQFEFIKVH